MSSYNDTFNVWIRVLKHLKIWAIWWIKLLHNPLLYSLRPFFSVTSWQFNYRKLTVYELFFFSYRLYLGAHGNETFLRQVEEPLIDTFEFGTLPRAPVWIASIPWDRYFEQIWQILATVLIFDTLPFFSFLSVTLFYFKIFIFKCNIWAKLSTCR